MGCADQLHTVIIKYVRLGVSDACMHSDAPSHMSSATDSETTINVFVNAVRMSFDYVATITAFSACLSTLFVVLPLSTNESRRRLAFRLSVFAIRLALTNPFDPVSTSAFTAAVAFLYFPPSLYDSILLTRLFVLYPPASTLPVSLLRHSHSVSNTLGW
ncbi:hypothetical protein BKA82DRAFT_312090 [Pisolithus tinctorius]|uniref:Uncharacterized protein n=1 Tax=Pisolithus tinctorius Marx 270 TaxID=870435 RepID=A0A0C3JD35_PISTI|nr:hypothetical protein BKA82DRAFT_312090 [Pisolithus tinctorius]KIN95591.1 hypothetical protein M404DRAFT_312090 [Pisolithus tinctorius Marx 270]